MEINQISTNGYKLTNVFDASLLNEYITLADTFTSTSTRYAADSPYLPLPLPGSIREVVNITTGEAREQLAEFFSDLIISNTNGDLHQLRGIEFWRDYPGYRMETHYDFAYVQNVAIIYLDGNGGENMGTEYYENGIKYAVEYEKNSGIILLNSDRVLHGMIGEVTNVAYRKTMYINWFSKSRIAEQE
jgi:hypothetical protein